MFEEVEFEDDEGRWEARESAPRHHSLSENDGDSNGTTFVSFHRPGDDGFSVVAGACDDRDAYYDSYFMSGDAWMSEDCQCVRCAALRVMSSVNEIKSDSGQTPVILLLDLDNYGFNQFKSIPPFSDVELIDRLYVWAFFGSCFTRHFKSWPSAESVCERLPSKLNTSTLKSSIWQLLVEKHRVSFTPCGGQSQAADTVMQQVLQALNGMHTILLTGDGRLINEVYRHRRLRGMKSKRENEKDMMSDRLTMINVLDMDKRFVPVWRAVCFRVRQITEGKAEEGDVEEERK